MSDPDTELEPTEVDDIDELEDALDEELDEELDDDPFLGDDGEGSASDDDEDDEEQEEPVAAPLDASEDGDDEFDADPAVDLAAIEGLEEELVEEEEEDDEVPEDDVIHDDEFVCASCHMAKRPSALADADEKLCRDCV